DRSLAQTLEDRSQQRRISAALHADHGLAWNLDVNRAAWRRLPLRINVTSSVGRLAGRRQHHWKQRCRCCRRFVQFAPLQQTTPLKNLVRVHAVGTRHNCHTRARLKCQFRYPSLLRQRSPTANRSSNALFLCNNHDGLFALAPRLMPEGNSGRLRTKWRIHYRYNDLYVSATSELLSIPSTNDSKLDEFRLKLDALDTTY